MSKKSTPAPKASKAAPLALVAGGAIHPKRGETSELSIYENAASRIAPYAQELDRTGTLFGMYQLRIGMELALIRQERGALAQFIKLAKSGSIGVKMSKRRIDTALAKFDACMKDLGWKKQDAPALIEQHGLQQLELSLWQQGLPKDENEMLHAMFEWCKRTGVESAEESLEEADKDKPAFGGKHGNANAEVDEVRARELAIEEQAQVLNEFRDWHRIDAYAAIDKDGNRPTLAEVCAMERPAQTLSLLTRENLESFLQEAEDSIATARYILATVHDGKPVVKRGKTTKGGSK